MVLLLVVWVAIFGRFFPNDRGRLGHDYCYFLPNLLDRFIWSWVNGPASVPWFTPSYFGGSLGAFTNVQRGFLGLPHVMLYWTDPLTAVRLTVLAYAALGLGSTYLLLRRSFGVSTWSALAGAGLFLFNGFYAHRMVIGHFGYRGFMALPLVAHLMLRPLPAERIDRYLRILTDGVLAGALLALLAMSDFASILPAGLLALVGIALVHGLWTGGGAGFLARFTAAGVAALGLSLAKLTAVAYFMRQTPRALYPLPGGPDLFSTTVLALRCLFVSPALDSPRVNELSNLAFPLDRHEWEFSVGFAALALLVWGAVAARATVLAGWPSRGRVVCAGMLGAILLAPIVLNTYDPERATWFRTLPLLGGSSSLFRWFCLYVPLTCVGAGLAVERIAATPRARRTLALLALAVLVLEKAAVDRRFYHRQDYDPARVIEAHQAVREGSWVPGVQRLVSHRRPPGPVDPRNESFFDNASELRCYDAVFGYSLEQLPPNALAPGPVLEQRDGYLNLVNPAALVWPAVNGGPPGTRFHVSQLAEATNFAAYRPFDFRFPLGQRLANALNVAAVAISLLLLFAGACYRRFGSGSRRASTTTPG